MMVLMRLKLEPEYSKLAKKIKKEELGHWAGRIVVFSVSLLTGLTANW